jgi:hypothetical protein
MAHTLFLGNAIHCLSASTYFVAAVFMADAARSAHAPHAPPPPVHFSFFAIRCKSVLLWLEIKKKTFFNISA